MKKPTKYKKITYIFIGFMLIGTIFIGQTLAQEGGIEELTAQIEELLKTVTSLQEKLANIRQNNQLTSTNNNFNHNLRIGDKEEDIKQLQIFLNSDFRTRLANTGVGSPGNETTYFGNLTKQAVIKFQELFSGEILIPVGLNSGTGFVGESTRAKLNSLQNNQNESSISQEEEIQNLFVVGENINVPEVVFEEYDELLLSFPSQYEGPVGTKISIGGVGFTKENNTIYFDDFEIPSIFSPTGTSVDVTVPSSLSIGKHVIYVSNDNGTSSKDLFFVVTEKEAVKPVILSVTPKKGSLDTEITITGINFTKTGNDVHTSEGTILGIPSEDGTTLKFKPTVDLDNEELSELKQQTSIAINWSIWFYVVNDNGVSEGVNEFIINKI